MVGSIGCFVSRSQNISQNVHWKMLNGRNGGNSHVILFAQRFWFLCLNDLCLCVGIKYKLEVDLYDKNHSKCNKTHFFFQTL